VEHKTDETDNKTYYNPNLKPDPHDYATLNKKSTLITVAANSTKAASKANVTKAANHSLATIDPLHPEGLVRAPRDKQYE